MVAFSAAHPSTHRHRRREQGYVMLTLMLMVTLIIIAAAAVAPTIAFEIRRDREMEMIHRGVQYSRAIRVYYKKFGRYPTRLEDLDNTNNLRYLRKHYKDPITGQDFKLLHYGDPGVTLTSSIGGGAIPGANTVGQMNASGSNGSAFGGPGAGGSAFSQSSGFGGNSGSAFGGNSGGFGGNTSGGVGGNSGGLGGNSNGGFGGGFNNSTNSGTSNTGGASNTPGGTNPPSGSDSTQASSQVVAGTAQGDTSSSGQQVFGGGPIVGVASTSKKDTIREFNHKKKYNEWQFVYDPTSDRGGLLTTPSQPQLQGFGGQPGQNGQPGTTNTNSSPFGQSQGSSFGQSPGSGNSGSGFGSNPAAPAQPPSPQAPQ